MIDQLFELRRIELLFAHQIDQNARIEIAAARAHDHPAGWGQSHAGVDRFAVFDRGNAGAIAEMGDDQAARHIVRKLTHDRFARKAVKPVALDALRLQFLGDRKYTRDLRHFGVKGGVEARHLRKPGKMLLCEADDRQSRGVCSGAKAVAASSCRKTGSSMRQCCRSFGPPCTIRCPMAAGVRNANAGRECR